MSFNLAGCEGHPVGSVYSGSVIGCSDDPIGFTPGVGMLFSLGHDGCYYNSYPEPDFLKDALVEWPVAQQAGPMYLIKWGMCSDPKIQEKIAEADQEVYQRNQDHFSITESLSLKRSKKASFLSQLEILDDEDKQLSRVLDKKELNEIWEPGLCSSEEELNELILGLHYRMSNCSQAEARRLAQEIKWFEMSREKVKSNDALRAWILEMSPKYATQGQVSDEALEEIRKKQETVRGKIKYLHRMIEVEESEIKSLEGDLAKVILERDQAYARTQELRKEHDNSNAFYYQNQAMLKNLKITATHGVINPEQLVLPEVDNFFTLWNSDKSFRDNYKRRIQPSLDLRQLDQDGRSRGLGNKPPVAEEGCSNSGAEEEAPVDIDKAASPEIVYENVNDLVIEKRIYFETVANATPRKSEEAEDLKTKLNEGCSMSGAEDETMVIIDKETNSQIVSENADDLVIEKSICFETVPNDTSGKRKEAEDVKMMKLKEGCSKSGAEEETPVIIDKGVSPEIASETVDDMVIRKSIFFKTVPNEEAKDVKIKLKEMRREEEIAKAKAATEKKKKLAEKNAAKAALRAQKEAEKKLKEIIYMHFLIGFESQCEAGDLQKEGQVMEEVPTKGLGPGVAGDPEAEEVDQQLVLGSQYCSFHGSFHCAWLLPPSADARSSA
ncbi:hypothetical protein SAY86_004043 [Trapa natans]|uniref:Uncharacterized protein n=1 Tax=Trapa natans TaxID=22666 RepID=A0AAN7RND9_TRANT|nr:hypothetical protein SAY86_004043 [Trapa natans]